MKRYILWVTFLTVFTFNSSSQTYNGSFWNLNTNHTGNTETYIFQDYVKMTPGFKYTAQTGKSFVAKIDPLFYYDTPYTDAQTSFSTDLPVGSLPGSVNVSPTGAATYSIPLALPPGTAGMMPGLSIVYNSQSGDGMLGRGWTIGGFSAITRVPSTIYHDGIVDGVDFDSNDRFALDGQRLINLSGTYGADGTVYHTEIESFSKIISYGRSGVGPTKFKVFAKNGMQYQYAYTEDSRLQAPGKNDVMSWMLNRVYDTNLNYYDISYTELNGEIYPSEITYTGKINGSEPYNKIKFFYTTKADKSIAYVAGSEFKQTVLLSDIKIFNNSELVRTYSFTYNFNSFSRLSEIQLSEGENKINTTKIEWGNEAENFSISGSEDNIDFLKYTVPGDFNNDGLTDIYTYDGMNYKRYETEIDEQGNINFNSKVGGPMMPSNRHMPFLSGDFNGDKMSDMLFVRVDDKEVFYFKTVEYTSGGPGRDMDVFSVSKVIDYKVGDFNGDGISDILIAQQGNDFYDTAFYKIYFGTVSGHFSSANWFSSSYKQNNLIVGDFNGNGISDFMMIINSYTVNSCQIYEYSDGNYNLIHSSGYPTKDHRIYTGDFNGDGKSDILTWVESAGWEIHLSNGLDWHGELFCDFKNTNDPNTPGFPINGISTTYDYFCVDMNGDGKDDIIEKINNTNFNTGDFAFDLNIYYSNGNSFTKEEQFFNGYSTFKYHFKPIIDINGDGNIDILVYNNTLTDHKVIFTHKNDQKNLVKSITNGNNNKTEFNYSPITDNNIYTKAESATFPVNDFQGALYVVKNLSSPDGIGGTVTLNFSYEGAKIHRQGKGFLGFDNITTTNKNTNISTSTSYYLDPVFFIRSSTITLTKHFDTCISGIYNNIYTQSLGNKIIFPQTTSVLKYDYLKNTSEKSYFMEYDDFGNLKHSYVDHDGDELTETLYQNYVNAGAWCPSKPSKTILKKQKGTKPLYQRISDFEYYSNGLLKKSIADSDDPINKITSEYWYNGRGLVTQTKVSASDLPAKNFYLYYDSESRFIIQKKDPLGFSTFQTHDEKTGNVLTETDINGHIITYTYDAFGTLIQTELPDGTKSYHSTHWYTGSSIAHARTYGVTSAAGEAPLTEYFDILGRKIQTESVGYNDETIISSTRYNNKGQIYRIYEPHFESDNANYTTSYYDIYGRQTSVHSPIGNTVYTYNGKTTTVTTPDGKQSSKTVNSLGQVISATDNGGTITYDYNSAGLPVTITAPGGANVTITYDNYGNKTSITDPDAGRITYTYDAFSNLRSQTDAKGNYYQMSYDLVGRLTEKIGPEGTTTYEYDTAPHGKGLPAAEIGINGNIKNYQYDDLSRLVSVTEAFEGENYAYTYQYDDLGRIVKTTYPNGFAYVKRYKDNGYLEQITRADNGELIWKALNRNALGQIKSSVNGEHNPIFTEKTYDDYHRLHQVFSGTNQQSGTFRNVEYNFEPETGNLLSRSDLIHGNTESFTYDNLDRLTEINTNGVVKTINYNQATGNITDKYDAGVYAYDENKIHAVTQVTGDVYVPSFDQNIAYTPFNKVESIDEGQNHLDFIYGLNNERKKTEMSENGTLVKTKYFFGSYEKTIDNVSGDVREYCWLPGGALYKTTNGTGQMLYLFKDYLGSITHIADDHGNIVEEFNYDAWGRARNPETLEYLTDNAQLSLINDRGYTGHEMLPTFGLINMNGRLYDPVLGRMLSPDNFVQAPDFTQNFNRYSYVLNNPLKYNDPDGEFVQLIVGAAMGAVMGYLTGRMVGATGWKLVGYMGVGALAGALTAGVGAGVSSMLGGGTFMSGFLGAEVPVFASAAGSTMPLYGIAQTSFINGATIGASTGFTSGFIIGTGTSLLEGQSIGESSLQGLKDGGMGALSGAITGGIAGGIDAAIDGRSFMYGDRKTIDVSNSIHKLLQPDKYSCSQTSASSNLGYLDKNKTPNDLIDLYPGQSKGKGLTDKEVLNMYQSEKFKTLILPTEDPKYYIAGQMQKGRAISLSYDTKITIDHVHYNHNVAVQRIKIFDSGRHIIRVMDPATGSFRRLSRSQYNLIKLLLSIF